MRQEHKKIHNATWEGTFTIFGVSLHCYTLDDGRRIVDADDFAALMESMREPDNGADLGELSEFNAWKLGVSPVASRTLSSEG